MGHSQPHPPLLPSPPHPPPEHFFTAFPLPMLSAHEVHTLVLAGGQDLSTLLFIFWRTCRASSGLFAEDHEDKTKITAGLNLPAKALTYPSDFRQQHFVFSHRCFLVSCWEYHSIACSTNIQFYPRQTVSKQQYHDFIQPLYTSAAVGSLSSVKWHVQP